MTPAGDAPATLSVARPDAAGSLHPKYRPDIDGLRAIAVLSVVAFHVGIRRLPGGFVGVDIFFVISGYLITLIMYREMQAGRFSTARFYERRIRRILPAFIATLLVTSVLAYRFLLPAEIDDYRNSAVASLLSASNFFFWSSAGYFDTPAQTKPLLHTWSLAVEEQCYILMPIVLRLVFRHAPSRVRQVVAGLALVSFALSVVGVFTSPVATFYLLHTRIWELLLGGLVAMDLFPAPRSALGRNILSSAGLMALAVAILAFNGQMPFPGLAALLPCAGAAAIILAGRNGPSVVGRVLSLRPVVFFGLISYSLYLWHWPVLVFQETSAFLISSTPRNGKIAVVLASIVLATLSWWLVERPFRRGAPSRTAVFGGAGAAMAAVLALLAVLSALPSRFPPAAVAVAAYLNTDTGYMRDGSCFISSKVSFSDFDRGRCATPVPGKRNVLLVGDSHAADLWFGLQDVLAGDNVMQATASGCKPVLADIDGSRCGRMVGFVFDEWLKDYRPDLLVISARWDDADVPRVDATLARLREKGIDTVLLGPIAEYDAPFPRLLAMSMQGDDPGLLGRHETDKHALDARLAAVAQRHGVRYVSLRDLVCPGGRCVEYPQPGVPIMFDYSHLTSQGSVWVAEQLRKSGALGS